MAFFDNNCNNNNNNNNNNVERRSGTAMHGRHTEVRLDAQRGTVRPRSSCPIAEQYLDDAKKRTHDDNGGDSSSPKRNSGARLCFSCRKWNEDIGARHPYSDDVLCTQCCEGECVVCKTDFAFGGEVTTNIWGAVVHEACMYPETPTRRVERVMPMVSDTTPRRMSTPLRRDHSPMAPSPSPPRCDYSPVAPSPSSPHRECSPMPPPPMSPCGASSPLPPPMTPSGTASSMAPHSPVAPHSPQSVNTTPPTSPRRDITPTLARRHSDPGVDHSAYTRDEWHAAALCVVRDSGRFNMFTEFDVARIIAAGFLALWGRGVECRAMLTTDVAQLAGRFFDWCFQRRETVPPPPVWTHKCLRDVDRSTLGWQRRAVDAVWSAAVDAGRDADLIHMSVAPVLMHGVVALSMPTHE